MAERAFSTPSPPCLQHASWCPANVTLHQFAESLGMAIDVKDDLTRTHSQEVAVMAHLIAKAMGLPEARRPSTSPAICTISARSASRTISSKRAGR